jgi:hypothetical protein
MRLFAIIVLTAFLVQPALSAATNKPTDSNPKPSSFVPHARSSSHVYGTPIQPAIVGHPKSSHHRQLTKKPASKPKK